MSKNVVKSIEELISNITVEINVQKQLSKVLGVVSMLCFKSVDQMIRNAEEKACCALKDDEVNTDKEKEIVNGSSTQHTNDVIIVSEKDANKTVQEVNWSL